MGKIHRSNSIGCTGSFEIYRIYANAESKHASMTEILFKMLLVTGIFVFALAAMIPVSYAIFGYPPPQHWLMPVEIQ